MSKQVQNNRYKKIENENNIKQAATKHINFGVAIFVMIFAYLLFVMITFAVKEKVNYTIAEVGVLTHSNQFKGLIIKDEAVVKATDSGDVRYFFTEGARVRKGNTVASIINDPAMAKLLDEEIFKFNQSLDADDPAFDESYDYLQSRIKNYVINQHNHNYDKTYAVKQEITEDIDNIRNTVITQQTSMGLLTSANVLVLEDELNENSTKVIAPRSGLISFDVDGFEQINRENFLISDLEREIPQDELEIRNTTKSDDDLFKVVDNYLWYIAAEIDDECEKEIEGKSYIGVEFTDRNLSIDIKVDDIWDNGERTYLMLKVDRMLGEFLGDRFVEFRIVYDEHEGIKIPETAVTTKAFAKIPEKFMSVINNDYRVHKKVYSEDAVGEVTLDGITVKQIKREEGYVYIPLSSELIEGDILSFTDKETLITYEHVIEDIEDIEGVYVVNKGYAMFKLIETRYQEVDYRIVEPFIPYGVRMYDRIATEAVETEEYQIIH